MVFVPITNLPGLVEVVVTASIVFCCDWLAGGWFEGGTCVVDWEAGLLEEIGDAGASGHVVEVVLVLVEEDGDIGASSHVVETRGSGATIELVEVGTGSGLGGFVVG